MLLDSTVLGASAIMSTGSKNVNMRVVLPLQDIHIWQRLVVGLRQENRFTLDEEPARFVDLIIDYAKAHKTVTLQRNTPLYRARINDSRDSGTPHSLDNMGAPPAHRAGHGRLNPRGIPYLYLASERITAVSEIRPWIGCEVTVAEFSLARDSELVNFSSKHLVNVPEGEEFEGPEFTWREFITWLFGAPFDPRDDTAYIPAQFLAEKVKRIRSDTIPNA